MPKDGKEKVDRATFYNHSDREFASRQFTSIATASNITALPSGFSFASNFISGAPDILSGEHDNVEYAAPMDMDMDIDDEVPPLRLSIFSGDIPGINIVPQVRAKRYANSVRFFFFAIFLLCDSANPVQDVPLATWVDHREEYLDEMMGLEGRGRFQSSCAGCRETFPEYRCKDCTHGALWCQKCLVQRHSQNPLHIVEVSL